MTSISLSFNLIRKWLIISILKDIAEDPAEDTVAVDETTENCTVEEVQENGEDSTNKKKPKLKTQKKEVAIILF